MYLTESSFKQVLHIRLTVDMCLIARVHSIEYINAELYVVDISLKYTCRLMCSWLTIITVSIKLNNYKITLLIYNYFTDDYTGDETFNSFDHHF